MNLNIMMDPKPLYPEMYHPRVIDWTPDLQRPAKYHNRTDHPTKYYFIDFGLSRKYDSIDSPPREPPIFGGDKSVPEFRKASDPCNPFPTDIYYLGNMIREEFLQKWKGAEFMKSLIDEMVQEDPDKRPDIDVVVNRFEQIRATLSPSKLRSRLVNKNETGAQRVFRGFKHVLRNIRYLIRFHHTLHIP